MNPAPDESVDAHQHFWRYEPTEYDWISEPMAAIRRDFLPADLRPRLDEAGVARTVAVQARQSIEETDWLLSLAEQNAWIAGVVGWLPMADDDCAAHLDRYADNPRLKGVRHVLQGEDDAYFAHVDFHRGLSLLPRYGLAYDLLIVERQLPAALALVDRHPNLPIVLDHIAKPRIAAGELEPWRTHMRSLARRPHLSCKLSGLVSEAKPGRWTAAEFEPYMEISLEAFGAERLLFGSDWPVCTVEIGYLPWHSMVRQFVASLSDAEQTAILGGNATRLYNLTMNQTQNVREGKSSQ